MSFMLTHCPLCHQKLLRDDYAMILNQGSYNRHYCKNHSAYHWLSFCIFYHSETCEVYQVSIRLDETQIEVDARGTQIWEIFKDPDFGSTYIPIVTLSTQIPLDLLNLDKTRDYLKTLLTFI